MVWDKETALLNTKKDSCNAPKIISAELIHCLYEYGVKKDYYKDINGTVANLIDIAISSGGYLYKYDLNYARGVIKNAINWESKEHI